DVRVAFGEPGIFRGLQARVRWYLYSKLSFHPARSIPVPIIALFHRLRFESADNPGIRCSTSKEGMV
ncbi:MAG: hypothetical protein L0229_25375, partial [Blastocatellia bacterium]|nr:hypothetical protein [Blastocatellia bacterium]